MKTSVFKTALFSLPGLVPGGRALLSGKLPLCFVLLALNVSLAHAVEWEMTDKFVVDGAATLKSSVTIVSTGTYSSSLWVSSSAVKPHLYVSTSGMVGIGTANPEANLSVVGVSSFTDKVYIPQSSLYVSSGVIGQILKKNAGGWLEWGYVGIPTGTISFFDLPACPVGWTELTAAQGRYLVGLPAGGTLAGTAGTALSNQENRATGQHNHGITDPGHQHYALGGDSLSGYASSGGYGGNIGPYAIGYAATGITINNTGSVAGTNAPYIQYRACKCLDSAACSAAGSGTPQQTFNMIGGAAGALVYQSAANVTAFLNIGANNTVLTSNGSVPAWTNLPDAALSGNVKLLTATQTFTADKTFSGNLYTSTNKFFVTGGSTGQLLRKNAAGYLEWGDASAVAGDSLGNHIATMTLNMNGQSVVSVASATFNKSVTAYSTVTIISPVNTGGASLWASTSAVTPHLYVSTGGRTGLGTASPGYTLDVTGGDINVGGVFRSGGSAGTALACVNEEMLKGGAVSGGILTAGTCSAGLTGGSESCPSDMVRIGDVCVDKYEGSVWSAPSGGTQYGVASDDYPCNDNGSDCTGVYARSISGVTPSASMTWFQASAACRNVGKRLLTNAEWQEAARGTVDPGTTGTAPNCNISGSGPTTTGAGTSCMSTAGVENTIGSVEEWVAEWGLTSVNTNWSAGYGNDGLWWQAPATVSGLNRGGFWGHAGGAGVFAFYAFRVPSNPDAAIGFRCGRSLRAGSWVNEVPEIVTDMTPQLGGDLDVNGKKIVSASNGGIVIEPNGTGSVYVNGNSTFTGTVLISTSVFVRGSATFGSSVTIIASVTQPAGLRVSTSAVTPHLYVSTTGNTGLGTAAPGYKLDVSGDANVSGVFRKAGTPGAALTCAAGEIIKGGTVSGGILTAGTCASGLAVPSSVCASDSVQVGDLCVDKYEGSMWSTPSGGTQYGISADDYPASCDDNGQNCTGVYARSVSGVTPSASMTWSQASAACRNAGKRLLTNAEWTEAARGTPDPGATGTPPNCNVSGGTYSNTGTGTNCMSTAGAENMIGNLWEWVADWGVTVAAGTWPAGYGSDQTWVGGSNPVSSMLRGGGINAAGSGVFAIYASGTPASSFASVTLRCVRTLKDGVWIAGLADVVTDVTPQLGGDLDVNGKKIASASNGNIIIEPSGAGSVYVNAKSTFTGAMLISSGVVVAGAASLASSVTITVPDTQPASLWVSTSLVTPHLYVSTGGSIGLGTAAPGYKLDVSGGDVNVSGVLRKAGTPGTALYCLAEQIIKGGTVSGGILTAGTCSSGISGGTESCAGDSVQVGDICVDKYEASVWATQSGGTQYGVSSDNYPCADDGQNCTDIYARSVSAVTPSGYATWFQASAACRNVGKRLLTNAEWQEAARGTPDPGAGVVSPPGCNVNQTSATVTGLNTGCLSTTGIENMVGSLWEWAGDWGSYVPTNTTWLNGDYVYGNGSPVGAVIRGGRWNNGTAAGVFAFAANGAPSNSGTDIGFRCARTLKNGTWTTGILDVLADATPQLGGDLDVNGKKIVSVSNGNIVIEPNGTGSLYVNARSTFTGAMQISSSIFAAGAATFNSSVTVTAPVTQPASLWASTSTVTPHLFVSTMGRVGIGTANPGYSLDVNGGDINVSGVFRKGGVAGTALTCAAGQIIKGGTVSGGIITAGTCADNLAFPSTTCPSDSVQVGELCVDKYEASVWSTPSGGTQYGTASDNYASASCNDDGQNCTGVYARSVSGVAPSGYITWHQAGAACRNVGKRLMTNAEWQEAVRGTVDPGGGADAVAPKCVNNGSAPGTTGTGTNCLSTAGAENMVGSLWEWVAEWGAYVPTGGNWTNSDYIWGNGTPIGMATRGGGWTNTTSGGMFSFISNYTSTDSYSSFGFRCVRILKNGTWAASGLSDIVGDVTPQLGGDLDVNGKKIVSVSNGNILIEPNGSGSVYVNAKSTFTGAMQVSSSIFAAGAGTFNSSVTIIVPATQPASLRVSTSAVTPHLYVSTTGSIGVGTAAPGYKLDVSGGDVNVSGVFRKGGAAGSGLSCAAGQIIKGGTISGGILTAGTCASGLNNGLQTCASDSVQIGDLCVDKYEGSVWSTPSGGSQYGTASDDYTTSGSCNDDGQNCTGVYARSVSGVTPSAYLTWFQASAACRNAGKRLLTNAEWMEAARGTPDPGATGTAPNCNVSGAAPTTTGAGTNCMSTAGAENMIGSLWEWVADWGATAVTTNWPAGYGSDGSWGGATPVSAVLRSGAYGNGGNAGVFAFYAGADPGYSNFVTGFRCVRVLRTGTWAGSGIAEVSADATPQLGWDLDVNGRSIVSVSNGDIVMEPGGTGSVYVNGKSTFTGTALFTGKVVALGPATFGSSATILVSSLQSAGLWVSTSAVTPHLYVSTTGSVGVGTGSPGEKLEVNGNVKAVSFISTSDERLKKDVRHMEGLDAILKLRGVRYSWAATGEGDAGVLAQELEQVFPDAVRADGPAGYKGVKYQYLFAPLIESTKELYMLIGTLRKENTEFKNRLEGRNAELERRLKAVE